MSATATHPAPSFYEPKAVRRRRYRARWHRPAEMLEILNIVAAYPGTIRDACEECQITMPTYYRWLAMRGELEAKASQDARPVRGPAVRTVSTALEERTALRAENQRLRGAIELLAAENQSLRTAFHALAHPPTPGYPVAETQPAA